MAEERTDEDKIIEILRIEGMVRQYDDLDFLPVKQSLYEEEEALGEYDSEISSSMLWCRPAEVDPYAQYFSEGNKNEFFSDEYNSDNTERLDVAKMKDLLMQLPEIKNDPLIKL